VEYPHRPYLTYLLSRRLTIFEILADCEVKLLVPPPEPYLRALGQELGPPPPSWAARVTNDNVAFRRWLRDKRLLSMWQGGPVQEQAVALLHAGDVRKAIEQLLLVHGEAKKVFLVLQQKYGDEAPAQDVIERFRDCFWNVGEMSRDGIFEFLKIMQQEKERAPAVRRDVAVVYGQLGLRQRIEAEELYDNIITLANQQLLAARKEPGMLSGSNLLGLAALGRQAIDAVAQRAELHTVGGQAAEDMRKQAIAFKLRTVQAARIIGIEDLDQTLVDQEPEDEDASNVRRFPGHPVAG